MADVDMTDAPAGPSTAKKAGNGGSKKVDGKKKFEVKKVLRCPVPHVACVRV
jgi:hypothetical protein